MKTHGKAWREERPAGKSRPAVPHWVVECEPFAMMRLKREFPRVKPESLARIAMAETVDVCMDLSWFMGRFPMEVSEADLVHLRAGVSAYELRRRQVESALEGRRVEGGPSPLHVHGRRQLAMNLALPARDYQQTAAELFWAVRRMLLGDALGLGKTVTAFTALSNPDCLPALIVSPPHLVKQWETQAARFVPGLRVRVLRSGDPTKESPTRVRGREVPFPDILITTYGKVGGWVSALAPFVSTLIAEEAHELRGDPAGVRNVAMRALSDAARYFMQLTATPIFNYGGEIFRVLDILSPGVLGTEEEFAREWCGGATRVEKARLSTQQLQALSNHLRLNGIMLRRTRKDVGRELPRAQTIIQSIPADMAVIEKAETASAELARIILDQQGIKGLAKLQAGQELDMKMRQATGIAKAPAVAEFVRTIIQSRDDGTPEPVVLTGWHREVYSIWAELLAEFKPAFFTGTESPAQKAESVRRFTSGETPLFIMSNRSGAGLDGLQAVCCNVVIGEPDWANGVHVQIGGRLDREGQTQEVTIWFPLADAGTDPIVAEVAGIKADQLTILLDPDAPLVEEVGNGEDRIRRLAEIVLKRRAGTAPAPDNTEAAA